MTDNPWAFPVSTIDGFTQEGMTLRDWFAGQWLTGMLAGGAKFEGPEMIASEAFAVADAMLEARKVSGDHP